MLLNIGKVLMVTPLIVFNVFLLYSDDSTNFFYTRKVSKLFCVFVMESVRSPEVTMTLIFEAPYQKLLPCL